MTGSAFIPRMNQHQLHARTSPNEADTCLPSSMKGMVRKAREEMTATRGALRPFRSAHSSRTFSKTQVTAIPLSQK